MKKNHIFVTGGFGLLGSELVKVLLETTNYMIILLNHVKDKKSSELDRRIGILNWGMYKDRIVIINGDISQLRCGLNSRDYDYVTNHAKEIFNVAALTNFNFSKDKLNSVNYQGTKNVYALSKDCKLLQKFNHISSLFIAGRFCGVFSEDSKIDFSQFNNYYEESKCLAEKFLLQESHNAEAINIIIYRPGVIVNSAKQSGGAKTVGMFYKLCDLLKSEIFRALPISQDVKLNLITSRNAAELILEYNKLPNKNKIYHILSKENVGLRMLVNTICSVVNCRCPNFITKQAFLNDPELTPTNTALIKHFIPYFQLQVEFLTVHAGLLSGIELPSSPEIKKLINQYYLKND